MRNGGGRRMWWSVTGHTRPISAWTPAGLAANPAEFKLTPEEAPPDSRATLYPPPNSDMTRTCALPVTSHKTTFVLDSQVKGPH